MKKSILALVTLLATGAQASNRTDAIQAIVNLVPGQTALLTGRESASGQPCQVKIGKSADAIDMSGGTEVNILVSVYVADSLSLALQTSAREITGFSDSTSKTTLKVRAAAPMDLVSTPIASELTLTKTGGAITSVSLKETQEIAFGFGPSKSVRCDIGG